MGVGNDGQPKQQTIVVGPLASFVPMKMLGTNGGGFYGMNSAHPFENPTPLSNLITARKLVVDVEHVGNAPISVLAEEIGVGVSREGLTDLPKHAGVMIAVGINQGQTGAGEQEGVGQPDFRHVTVVRALRVANRNPGSAGYSATAR